jgi:hypothetical protein
LFPFGAITKLEGKDFLVQFGEYDLRVNASKAVDSYVGLASDAHYYFRTNFTSTSSAVGHETGAALRWTSQIAARGSIAFGADFTIQRSGPPPELDLGETSIPSVVSLSGSLTFVGSIRDASTPSNLSLCFFVGSSKSPLRIVTGFQSGLPFLHTVAVSSLLQTPGSNTITVRARNGLGYFSDPCTFSCTMIAPSRTAPSPSRSLPCTPSPRATQFPSISRSPYATPVVDSGAELWALPTDDHYAAFHLYTRLSQGSPAIPLTESPSGFNAELVVNGSSRYVWEPG